MSKHLPTAEEDPEYHSLTAALGMVITCWARVEDELAHIFTHATNSDATSARAVFYAVRSFEARRDLVKAALAMPRRPGFPPAITSEWERLLNAIIRKTPKRNEIAHCAIVKCVDFDGKAYMRADPYCAWTGQRHKEFDKLLSAKQVLERADGFIGLAARIALFEEDVARYLMRKPQSVLLKVYPHLRAPTEAIRIQAASATPPEP